MKKQRFQTSKGVVDKLPGQAYSIQKLSRIAGQNIEKFGYSLVDTPVLEDTDLFLLKSGPDLTRKIYRLATGKRNLCLRPEFTPSIIRLYVEKMQMLPKPVKLYYSGPVFRYEQPGESTYRQFTVTGMELFGASGPAADGEIIGLAYDTLAACGISDYKLVIGHIGLITYILTQFGLDKRSIRFIMTGLESLRKEQLSKTWAGLNSQTIFNPAILPEIKTAPQSIAGLKPEVKQALETMLDSVDLEVNSSRSKEEISERMISKMRQFDQSKRMAKLIELIKQFITVRGSPADVFRLAPDILNHYQIDKTILSEFQKTVESLNAYGIDKNKIEIDFGLGRGINYYTGMVFEIYSQKTGQQLCGGGRYDEMTQILGGKQFTPAAGSTIGLERVLQSVNKQPKTKEIVLPVKADIIIIPVGEEDIIYAVQVAQKIRKQTGLIAELDIKPNRNMSRTLEHAAKHAIPLVAIVGSDEQKERKISLKNLATREQLSINFDDVQKIKDILNEKR